MLMGRAIQLHTKLWSMVTNSSAFDRGNKLNSVGCNCVAAVLASASPIAKFMNIMLVFFLSCIPLPMPQHSSKVSRR